MDNETTLIQYFALNDGELFCIQDVDYDNAEPNDQILMERSVAIDIAKYILKTLGDDVDNG